MHKTPEITRLIHENFWLVMAFALSRPNVDELLDKRFLGEWKYLRKSFYELAEVRADQHCSRWVRSCECSMTSKR